MSTHTAVVTVGIKQPVELLQVPTITPTGSQVRIRNEWTASTPLDMHQNDGGLLVKHPQILGDGVGGTVVEVGPDAKRLKVGDKVFGFSWRNQAEKAYQEFVTTDEYVLAKLPSGFSLAEAVTLPNNFVTVFHTFHANLKIPTPWPKPENYVPPNPNVPILIWGGSSSVGQFAIEILTYYGYTNVLATASRKNHEHLKSLGAKEVFDYKDAEIVEHIKAAGGKEGIPLIYDCIGSAKGSLAPIAKIAQRGARVAVLLPVIVKDSSDTDMPEYEMDVEAAASWAEGVVAEGVRTHFYLDNPEFKEKLQPEIMPTMLAQKIVRPQKQKIVEGKTLLERAQKAMDMLRRKEASMERLVWKVSDEA